MGSLPIFVNSLLLFFLWVVCTCVLICLVLLMDEFPSLIFIDRVFHLKSNLQATRKQQYYSPKVQIFKEKKGSWLVVLI